MAGTHGQAVGAQPFGKQEDQASVTSLSRKAAGLELLLEAYRYASDLSGQNGAPLEIAWNFAVELQALLRSGFHRNDLRWMMLKQYLLHGFEECAGHGDARKVRLSSTLHFEAKSCFILSSDGARWAAELLKAGSQAESTRPNPISRSSRATLSESDDCEPLLQWDRDRSELRINGRLVKKFRSPARNQQMILEVFQEEGWPPRIDDPLPPEPGIDSKRRLHDTIASLNRKQVSNSIRFCGDGQGTGVCWELLVMTSDAKRRRKTT